LRFQLYLQITHLLLVILNEVDQLEDLLAGFLLIGFQGLDLILAAADLLPQVLILCPENLLLL